MEDGRPRQALLGYPLPIYPREMEEVDYRERPERRFREMREDDYRGMQEMGYGDVRGGRYREMEEGGYGQTRGGRYREMAEGRYRQMQDPRYIEMQDGRYHDMPEGRYRDMPESRYRDVPEGRYRDVPEDRYRDIPEGRYRDMSEGRYRDMPEGRYRDMPEGRYRDMPEGRYRDLPEGRAREMKGGERYRDIPENSHKKMQDRYLEMQAAKFREMQENNLGENCEIRDPRIRRRYEDECKKLQQGLLKTPVADNSANKPGEDDVKKQSQQNKVEERKSGPQRKALTPSISQRLPGVRVKPLQTEKAPSDPKILPTPAMELKKNKRKGQKPADIKKNMIKLLQPLLILEKIDEKMVEAYTNLNQKEKDLLLEKAGIKKNERILLSQKAGVKRNEGRIMRGPRSSKGNEGKLLQGQANVKENEGKMAQGQTITGKEKEAPEVQTNVSKIERKMQQSQVDFEKNDGRELQVETDHRKGDGDEEDDIKDSGVLTAYLECRDNAKSVLEDQEDSRKTEGMLLQPEMGNRMSKEETLREDLSENRAEITETQQNDISETGIPEAEVDFVREEEQMQQDNTTTRKEEIKEVNAINSACHEDKEEMAIPNEDYDEEAPDGRVGETDEKEAENEKKFASIVTCSETIAEVKRNDANETVTRECERESAEVKNLKQCQVLEVAERKSQELAQIQRSADLQREQSQKSISETSLDIGRNSQQIHFEVTKTNYLQGRGYENNLPPVPVINNTNYFQAEVTHSDQRCNTPLVEVRNITSPVVAGGSYSSMAETQRNFKQTEVIRNKRSLLDETMRKYGFIPSTEDENTQNQSSKETLRNYEPLQPPPPPPLLSMEMAKEYEFSSNAIEKSNIEKPKQLSTTSYSLPNDLYGGEKEEGELSPEFSENVSKVYAIENEKTNQTLPPAGAKKTDLLIKEYEEFGKCLNEILDGSKCPEGQQSDDQGAGSGQSIQSSSKISADAGKEISTGKENAAVDNEGNVKSSDVVRNEGSGLKVDGSHDAKHSSPRKKSRERSHSSRSDRSRRDRRKRSVDSRNSSRRRSSDSRRSYRRSSSRSRSYRRSSSRSRRGSSHRSSSRSRRSSSRRRRSSSSRRRSTSSRRRRSSSRRSSRRRSSSNRRRSSSSRRSSRSRRSSSRRRSYSSRRSSSRRRSYSSRRRSSSSRRRSSSSRRRSYSSRRRSSSSRRRSYSSRRRSSSDRRSSAGKSDKSTRRERSSSKRKNSSDKEGNPGSRKSSSERKSSSSKKRSASQRRGRSPQRRERPSGRKDKSLEKRDDLPEKSEEGNPAQTQHSENPSQKRNWGNSLQKKIAVAGNKIAEGELCENTKVEKQRALTLVERQMKIISQHIVSKNDVAEGAGGNKVSKRQRSRSRSQDTTESSSDSEDDKGDARYKDEHKQNTKKNEKELLNDEKESQEDLSGRKMLTLDEMEAFLDRLRTKNKSKVIDTRLSNANLKKQKLENTEDYISRRKRSQSSSSESRSRSSSHRRRSHSSSRGKRSHSSHRRRSHSSHRRRSHSSHRRRSHSSRRGRDYSPRGKYDYSSRGKYDYSSRRRTEYVSQRPMPTQSEDEEVLQLNDKKRMFLQLLKGEDKSSKSQGNWGRRFLDRMGPNEDGDNQGSQSYLKRIRSDDELSWINNENQRSAEDEELEALAKEQELLDELHEKENERRLYFKSKNTKKDAEEAKLLAITLKKKGTKVNLQTEELVPKKRKELEILKGKENVGRKNQLEKSKRNLDEMELNNQLEREAKHSKKVAELESNKLLSKTNKLNSDTKVNKKGKVVVSEEDSEMDLEEAKLLKSQRKKASRKALPDFTQSSESDSMQNYLLKRKLNLIKKGGAERLKQGLKTRTVQKMLKRREEIEDVYKSDESEADLARKLLLKKLKARKKRIVVSDSEFSDSDLYSEKEILKMLILKRKAKELASKNRLSLMKKRITAKLLRLKRRAMNETSDEELSDLELMRRNILQKLRAKNRKVTSETDESDNNNNKEFRRILRMKGSKEVIHESESSESHVEEEEEQRKRPTKMKSKKKLRPEICDSEESETELNEKEVLVKLKGKKKARLLEYKSEESDSDIVAKKLVRSDMKLRRKPVISEADSSDSNLKISKKMKTSQEPKQRASAPKVSSLALKDGEKLKKLKAMQKAKLVAQQKATSERKELLKSLIAKKKAKYLAYQRNTSEIDEKVEEKSSLPINAKKPNIRKRQPARDQSVEKETNLNQMEEFLDKLRATKKDLKETELYELEISKPDLKESKFLDKVRAKRKAKLMASVPERGLNTRKGKKYQDALKEQRIKKHLAERSRISELDAKKLKLLKKMKAEREAITSSGQPGAKADFKIQKTAQNKTSNNSSLGKDENLESNGEYNFETAEEFTSSQGGKMQHMRKQHGKPFDISFAFKDSRMKQKELSRVEVNDSPAAKALTTRKAQALLNSVRAKKKTKAVPVKKSTVGEA